MCFYHARPSGTMCPNNSGLEPHPNAHFHHIVQSFKVQFTSGCSHITRSHNSLSTDLNNSNRPQHLSQQMMAQSASSSSASLAFLALRVYARSTHSFSACCCSSVPSLHRHGGARTQLVERASILVRRIPSTSEQPVVTHANCRS